MHCKPFLFWLLISVIKRWNDAIVFTLDKHTIIPPFSSSVHAKLLFIVKESMLPRVEVAGVIKVKVDWCFNLSNGQTQSGCSSSSSPSSSFLSHPPRLSSFNPFPFLLLPLRSYPSPSFPSIPFLPFSPRPYCGHVCFLIHNQLPVTFIHLSSLYYTFFLNHKIKLN